ncbi:hypothetical protein HZS_6685 [Henneguya salminicola]|nr:hypothetical protein HZS_6685 [Henneguya salminicola]
MYVIAVKVLLTNAENFSQHSRQCLCCFGNGSKNCPAPIKYLNQNTESFILPPFMIRLKNGQIQLREDPSDFWPLFVFINIRGGKCKGVEFARAFRALLNPIQVWDIPVNTIECGLNAIKLLPRFRLLICGGDGTVGWVLSEIDKSHFNPTKIKIAVFPLGTGNDFSRVFGWGRSFDKLYKLQSRLNWINYSVPVPFDRFLFLVIVRWKIVIHTRYESYSSTSTSSIFDDIDKKRYNIIDRAQLIKCYLIKTYLTKTTKEFDRILAYIWENTADFIKESKIFLDNTKKISFEYLNYIEFYAILKRLESLNEMLPRVYLPRKFMKEKSSIPKKKYVEKNKWSVDDIMICRNLIEETEFKIATEKLYIPKISVDSPIFNQSDYELFSHKNNIEIILTKIKLLINQIILIINQKQPLLDSLDFIQNTKNNKCIEKNTRCFYNKNTRIERSFVLSDMQLPLYPSLDSSLSLPPTQCLDMNNYFGIGLDAKIALDFHLMRQSSPQKFESRTINKLYYGCLGAREFLTNSCRNLQNHILLECDGIPIKLPTIQAIAVLNIPSYMSGVNFWGPHPGNFQPQSYNDGLLEVCLISGIEQMSVSRVFGGYRSNRIAQCRRIKITLIDFELPIQIDGEAWLQQPCVINISYKNSYIILKRPRKNDKINYKKKSVDGIIPCDIEPSAKTDVLFQSILNNLKHSLIELLEIIPLIQIKIDELSHLFDTLEIYNRKSFDQSNDGIRHKAKIISEFIYSLQLFYHQHKLHSKGNDANKIINLRNSLKEIENSLLNTFLSLKI